jgi:hypothetical protein
MWNLWLQRKVWQQIFYHPSLLLLFLDPGSGMGKNQDLESGINIPDPQHWKREWKTRAKRVERVNEKLSPEELK